MLICKRCHAELASEAAARRHFALAHTDERPVEDLAVHLSGLARGDAAVIVRIVERLRAGGDGAVRLRGRLREALADAAELEGNLAELAAIEALA